MGLEENTFLCMSEMPRHVTTQCCISAGSNASRSVFWSSACPGCFSCVSSSRERQREKVKYCLCKDPRLEYSAMLQTPHLFSRKLLHLCISSVLLHKTFGSATYFLLAPTLPFYSKNPMKQMLSLFVHSLSQVISLGGMGCRAPGSSNSNK